MSSNDILPYEKSVIFVSRKTYEFYVPIAIGIGNVSATISDRKITIAVMAGNAVESYNPEVLSQQDYFPFSAALSICDSEWLAMRTLSEVVKDVALPLVLTINLDKRVEVGMGMMGRSMTAEGYRYGYQKQEIDDELWGGAVSYKYRIEDPRLGRFFSVDPLAPKYPHNSPYAFSENRIMDAIELEGLECYFIHGTMKIGGFKPYPGVNGEMMGTENLLKFEKLFGNTKTNEDFNWDGNLTRRSRKNAAKALAKHIEATMLGGDEPITLIGHSHGGNVAIDAVNILISKGLVTADKINIVALNTPALTVETNLKYDDVDLYAVNADWDKIQHGGTDNPGKPTVKGADGVIEYEDQEEGSFYNHNGWLDCNVDEYFMELKITVENFEKSKSKKIQSKELSESDLRKVDIELKTDKIQAPNGKK